MGQHMVSSKDKEKVLRFARKEGRMVLWKDAEGVWHAAFSTGHVPKYATEVEQVEP